MSNQTLIKTLSGDLRVWETSPNYWLWATPNGSQGNGEPSFEEAVSAAFHAEGLNPTEYGYKDFEAEEPNESGK